MVAERAQMQLQKTDANRKSTSKSRKYFHHFDSRWCKCSQHKQIKKHTANAHNTSKYILFAARFFFGCVVSVCSVSVVKLTKVFSYFARIFFYLQRVSFLGCVVSVYSMCVVKLTKVFS